MSRDISQFLIDVNTDSPLSDIIKVSKVFDSIDHKDHAFLTERYMLKYVYLSDLESDDSEEKLRNDITWFNTEIVKVFLNSLNGEAFETVQQRLKELD